MPYYFVCIVCGRKSYSASSYAFGGCPYPYCGQPIVAESTEADETVRINRVFPVKEFEELVTGLQVSVEMHRGKETQNLEQLVYELGKILAQAETENLTEVDLGRHPLNRFFLYVVTTNLEDTIEKGLPGGISPIIWKRLRDFLQDIYRAVQSRQFPCYPS